MFVALRGIHWEIDQVMVPDWVEGTCFPFIFSSFDVELNLCHMTNFAHSEWGHCFCAIHALRVLTLSESFSCLLKLEGTGAGKPSHLRDEAAGPNSFYHKIDTPMAWQVFTTGFLLRLSALMTLTLLSRLKFILFF